MKELMKTNIYDVDETIIIVGSCLRNVEPIGYKKLELYTDALYSRWIKKNDEYRWYKYKKLCSYR